MNAAHLTRTGQELAVLSVTEASNAGLSKLLTNAEAGSDVIVARHGTPVAAVVGMSHLAEIRELKENLLEAMLIVTRAATDDGTRHSLDEIATSLGFDPAELRAKAAAELAASKTA